MSKSMLIDAAHSEETRVVVIGPNGLEEFDFESASLRTLKGNIYLAKVTRVEPSLQAAFVSYGGNRHGFLPFSEIHPDYYRIPIADREALLAETAAEQQDRLVQDDDVSNEDDVESPTGAADDDNVTEAPSLEISEDQNLEQVDEIESNIELLDGSKVEHTESQEEAEEEDTEDGELDEGRDHDRNRGRSRRRQQRRRHPSNNRYKIQEVIKRGQIMLVQVGKEERGGKGAAMTTFISLAGRYCVLMPNTGNGGGISRKITDANDRKRLKSLIDDLDLPGGMATIVRTAGVQRTKAELKRDHEFLLRLWDEIRERTLSSSAPALIYEEASLVKRAIRDLYGRDVDEVLVEGDDCYREAKDFMRSLMPSHAKRVQPYKDPVPLFQARGVEGRLESLFHPIVRLPSGGYLVINQTEALVAIDVNSGRSTRERNIEETALKTNLEAAVEAARQLRLRELAGIVVIDFIDMDERRNNAAVERKLKESIKADRARVHVGRMSPLGLVELSRQRLRPSMFETNFHECEMCAGLGRVRSVESNALGLLRAAEDCAFHEGGGVDIAVKTATETIVYLLNHKRDGVRRIEEVYGVRLLFTPDDTLAAHERIVEVIGRSSGQNDVSERNQDNAYNSRHDQKDDAADDRSPQNLRRSRKRVDERNIEESQETEEDDDENGNRRRRRGRRGGRRRKSAENDTSEISNGSSENERDDTVSKDGEKKNRRPRRRKSVESDTPEISDGISENEPVIAVAEDSEVEQKNPRRRRRRRSGVNDSSKDINENVDGVELKSEPTSNNDVQEFPTVASAGEVDKQVAPASELEHSSAEISSDTPPETPAAQEETESKPSGPPRTGWWRRLRS
jgi:ribonuclease E